jgi:hypothetical protein
METRDISDLAAIRSKLHQSGYYEKWYLDQVSNRSLERVLKVFPNKLYTFQYVPITKNLLIYDYNPIIYCLRLYPNGFLGLNFHHLIKFIDRLNAVFKLIEEILLKGEKEGILAIPYTKIPLWQKIIRRYRYDRIRLKTIYTIEFQQWIETVTLIPNTIKER